MKPIKRGMTVSALLGAAALAAGLALGSAAAQEHPQEHPQGPKPAAITKEDLGRAIRDYVKKDAELKGGYFLVYDTVAKKPLVLTLEKVHDDKLARVADDVYFACADFKEAGGATYDLDIFMKGTDPAHLEATEVIVHKENGKERYGWVEESGVWKRKEK